MSDFAVEYGVLGEYGSSMATRAAEASATLRATRVDSTAASMPGGLAAMATGLLQSRYESAARRVEDHLSSHPKRLIECAAAYREAESSGIGLISETFGH